MISKEPTSALRRELYAFALLTALISMGLWSVLLISGADIHGGSALWIFGVAASGPSLAALLVFIARFRRRVQLPEQRVSAPWFWAPASIVLGALPAVVAALLVDPNSVASGLAAAPGAMATFGGPIMFVVMFLVAGPIAEEFGWRGFVQPRLRLRWGVVRTSVVLGCVWALWHVPLFFLPGTGQFGIGLLTPGGLIFALSCIPLSFIYLFVSERMRGRAWAAILIHFSGNAMGALLPTDDTVVRLVQLAVTVAIAAVLWLAWGPSRGPVGATPIASESSLATAPAR